MAAAVVVGASCCCLKLLIVPTAAAGPSIAKGSTIGLMEGLGGRPIMAGPRGCCRPLGGWGGLCKPGGGGG